MKVWYQGKFTDINIGDEVTICRLGGFLHNHLFGEPGRLVRCTQQHMVFESKSGGIVKTKIDNLHATVGKGAKAGYFISLKKFSELNIIATHIRYWNSETCEFDKK